MSAPAHTDGDATVAIRVLTFNIRHGEGIDDRLDLERIARIIHAADADVVALQEVDRHFGGRSQFLDQTWWLGRRLGMTAVYGPDMTLPPPDIGRPLREYGNAILSRLPIETWDHVPLPAWPGLESRGLLRASVLADKVPVAVWTAHLSHENPEQRAEQARAITRIIPEAPTRLILTGDLNDVPESPTLSELTRTLTDTWAATRTEHGRTYDSVTRTIRIDYILTSADVGIARVDLIDVGDASDHLAVIADLLVPRE
ncbi:endonuclease/exonuclease/phosphatase family protein [Phytoactinopolyspora mesophila]|uniref:Metal-dependent hydrolase n=1 Tax=Phytoactinopolyspora mesophila TaxID=2650750 RepID=A0A7K3M4J5_9ACTN|nr:endonuclease/exonuclease/phosphatase family protein [Phytoactinopolyspora mesophila]NDL57842.1 metal-dependent hydrolase [Phytoactinopolyspora mesophila]